MTTIEQYPVLTDAKRRARPAPEWSIEHVIPSQGIGMVYGASYTGKTFVALDLALTVCNGLDNWYGHPVNTEGNVLYVLMEGEFDFVLRIDAWMKAHPECDDRRLYTIEEQPVSLANVESIARLAISIRNVEPVLVIIDTQALATPGVDENSNTDMGMVMANLKRLSQISHCPILTVHHAGKDLQKGVRGASSQHAALDFLVQVQPGMLKVAKVKGWKPSEWLEFFLEAQGESVWAKSKLNATGKPIKGIAVQIIDYLKRHPDEYTKTQVLDAFNQNARAKRVFEQLVEDYEIESREVERIENNSRRSKRLVWHAGVELEIIGEYDDDNPEEWSSTAEQRAEEERLARELAGD